MPIVNPNDTGPVKPIPHVQHIAKPLYKGVTVDTKLENVSHLLTHVEGSSWTVNYYSQALNQDSAVAGQGLGTNPVHQQYRLIKGMELKVTTPLTTSQDPTSRNLLITGAASVYPFIIPNEGDMFLADVGAGREGVFEITDVTRLSVMKQTVHSIEYRMVDYTDSDRLNDFAAKTVQTFQYDKEFLQFGQNPLLFEEEYADVQFLRLNYRSIVDRYFKAFFSKEIYTMLVPGQDHPTYDHYLVTALLNHFSTWDSEEIRYIRRLNVEDDYALRATQIWEVLSKRDKNLLRDAFLQVGKVWTADFTADPMAEGIRWTKVKEVVYPVDPLLTVDYQGTPPPKFVNGNPFQRAPVKMTASSILNPGDPPLREGINDVLGGYGVTNADGSPITDQTVVPPPFIHRAMLDGYYVFSKAFYQNDRRLGNQSQLELMVHDYLDNKALSFRRLRKICEDMNHWNAFDRFYFTPVVMLLMKASIRSI